MKLEEAAADLRELTDVLRRRDPAELRHGDRTARIFFRRLGREPGDLWFEKKCWSMHAYASQGFASCIHDVMSGARMGDDGFPIERPARRVDAMADLPPPAARRPAPAAADGGSDRDQQMATGKATA